LQAKKDLEGFKTKRPTYGKQCIDTARQDKRQVAVETPDTSDDDTTPSSEQSISATVGPKDVGTTDRCSVVSSCTLYTLNRY